MTDLTDIENRGLVLLGCGKMGGAMLEGWLAHGVSPGAVTVLDPYPGDWLQDRGVNVNSRTPDEPAVLLIAVKPQMMDEALPTLPKIGSNTLVISVAAGTPISRFEATFGAETPVIRAMPNTPSAIGQGITAIIGNAVTNAGHLDLAEGLLSAVGTVVRLDTEDQMDAVTAVSGSGPAYVFHLIETMTAAGIAEGLPEDLATKLATETVAGAGALAKAADESASQLRVNVTSPKGTTEAALGVLMNKDDGFPSLLERAVKAAADRSRELRK